MKSFFRNEKGMSLVELLAALAIGSIILLFISTVHIFIQNQYNSQSTEVKELTDITVVIRSITKDIRSVDEIETSGDFNQIRLTTGDDSTIYLFENNILYKNSAPFIYELEEFKVKKTDSKIALTIKNQSGKEIQTEIVMREADE